MRIRVRKSVLQVLSLFAVFGLLLFGAYVLLNRWESRTEEASVWDVSDDDGGELYVYLNGRPYIKKTGLTTLLLIGIDKEGEMTAADSYINDGQNDFNALLVLDEESNSYTLVLLNRDTMLKVNRLGVGGAVVGSYTMQLALAHTYGSGMADSCENTVTAVEDFLYGEEISHYFAMNMTAVATMVDAIGGITVTIQDDFSQVDASLVQGETLLLNGAQCVTYIRTRQGVGDQTNLSRSERQRSFLWELLAGMSEKTQEALGAMSNVADCVLSDLSANRLKKLLEKICDAECADLLTPEGEAVLGEEYMEFYADDASVREIVISLFYRPVEETDD